MAKVIAIANQKGGVGKTTTTINLGIGLAKRGKRVLLMDFDPQGNLTSGLGYRNPDELQITITTIMEHIINDNLADPLMGILHQPEGVDLMPANIQLSGMEVTLVNTMSRETILRQYITALQEEYDYILLDCMPSLGLLPINAFAAAHEILIPVQSQYYSLEGLQQIFRTIAQVRKCINPQLAIAGMLITMANTNTNFARDVIDTLHTTYGNHVHIFSGVVPISVRAMEASAEGKSMFLHDPNGKIAAAYETLTEEILTA